MEDTTKKKLKRVTFEWTDEETQALDTIAKMEPFATLGSSRRAIVRFVLLTYAQTGGMVEAPATKSDIAELAFLLRGLTFISKAAGKEKPAVKPPRANAAVSLDDKIAAGSAVCDALGGAVNGTSCTYKKYEVMATGRPVSFDVSEPLASLTEATITQQFDPSREAYERAVAEWKDE